jgi:hypothetical protein
MNRDFADVVIKNHPRNAIHPIHRRQMVKTPAAALLPQALSFLETNGEPLPEQLGRLMRSGQNSSRSISLKQPI